MLTDTRFGHSSTWKSCGTEVHLKQATTLFARSVCVKNEHLCINIFLAENITHPQATWQWKFRQLKMYCLLNMGIFQWHVSFQGCTPNYASTNLAKSQLHSTQPPGMNFTRLILSFSRVSLCSFLSSWCFRLTDTRERILLGNSKLGPLKALIIKLVPSCPWTTSYII